MDWKTYEQGKAVGAELKARREAEAKAAAPQKPAPQKSAQPSATAQPGAPARKAPAKPAAVTTVGAPVAAKPTQTKPSAASVVTPPVTEATRKSTLDADLRQDLKLDYLYSRARTASDMDEAVGRAAKETGLQPQRYKELAAVQGVDLEDLDKKARNGMPFENYRQAKKDAIGFVPVEQRAAMFEEVAKDYAAAEKGEVRTDKRIGIAAAEEAPGTIPGFTTGYVVGGTTAEETTEVVKPGEHYYAIAQKFIEAVDKDPEAVKLVNLYGNSLAGGASQKYINDRTRQLMKNKGITPDSPDADRQAGLARRQATFEVLARKTVGQWTPAVFVKDVQVTDDAEQTTNPFAALYPNIELIGFNNKGDAVFRQESPAGVMLRTLDLIGVVPIPGKGKVIPVPIPGQSLLAGLATKGEDESYTAAMSRGVQTGANWLEYALDESKGAPLPVRALAGTAGLVAAVVHPDVTAAAGSLNEAQKALRVTYKNKQIAKQAVPILEELIEAYKANNFDRASALEKKLADNELLGTRAKGHSIVKAYDRNDAAFAMALASMNPALKHTSPFLVDDLVAKIGAKGDDALTEFVYETAGKGAPHMHFSAAAPELAERTKEGAVGASFMTFLDAGNFQRRKERIQAALDAYKKAIPQTAEEALSKTVNDAVERIRGTKDSMDAARIAGVPEEEITRNLRLAELMEQNKAMLIADPVDGAEQFKNILRADPITGGPENETWRAGVYRRELGRTTKRLKELKAKDYQAVLSDDLQMFNDALAAVDTNVKSRMMAAESLRRNLAERANIEITPIDILDEVLEPGTERLSPYAQASFLVTARQFPKEEMDRKELYLAYQALDEAFQGVAERHGVPVENIWRDFFVRVEEGAEEMPGTDAAKAAGKPPPKPPAALPAVPSDVPKLANVPKGDPKIEAAITEAAQAAGKKGKGKAGAKAAAMLHPRTADVIAEMPEEFKGTKLNPDDVSKIMTVFTKLGFDANFPASMKGVDKETLDAVVAYLMMTGEIERKGKKLVKVTEIAPETARPAAEVAKVAPVAAPKVDVESIRDELESIDDQIADAQDDIAAAIEDVDDNARAESQALEERLFNRKVQLEAQLKQAEAAPTPAPAPPVVEAPKAVEPVAAPVAEAVVEAVPVEAKAAEAVAEAPARTPEAFAAEIAAGKKMEAPEDLQFYENNRAAVEAELKRLAPAAPVEAPVKAAKAPRGKRAVAPVPAPAPAPVETATVDELQAAINNADESLDEVAETLQRAEDDTNEAQATWLRGVEKDLRERKAGLQARLTRLQAAAPRNLSELPPEVQAKVEDLAGSVYENVVEALKQPDAVRQSPQAYADSYKDVLAEMWDSPYDFERAWPAMRDRVEFAAANALDSVAVPATMENLGNRALWKNVEAKGRIGASTGMLEARVGSMEFRISTVPAAKEGAPPVFQVMARAGDEFENLGPKAGYATLEDALRALTPAGGKPAPLRAKIDSAISSGVRKASIPKKGAKQAKVVEEVAEDALDEAVPEQVARLEEAAPVAEEVPAVAAAPTMTGEQYRAKAVDELGKITHSVVKADGTKVYGVVEGDMFVPKYTLAPGEMRDPTDALYFKASRGNMAVDAPRTLKEVGAQPESLQRVVQKIRNMDESDLYQLGVVEAEKGVGRLVQKGKFEVLTPEQIKELRNKDSATAMITLFRGAADPTTLLHEGAHYIRRMGLDSDDMDAITNWIKTEGVDVTNYYGTFKGTPEAVEQAEELFARAFEQYMLKGEAPQPALKVLFEKVKDVFVKVYRNLSRGPLGKEIRPEVKAVFDRLFTRVPDKKVESTFDMLMRNTFNNKGMEQEGGLTVLAREAKRRGMGGKSVEDLAKLVAEAPNKYGKDAWLESVVIEFPVDVFGKREWTGADILELSNRVQTRRNDLALAPLKQALFGDPEEEALTESIFTALLPKQGEGNLMTATRTVGSVFAHSIIGGDIVDERKMRNLLPEVRRSLNTSTRIIEQAIGDTITVLEQTIRTGDMNFMYRYLAGETGMTYESGRRVISSGHEFIDGFMSLYRNAGNALTSADQALLQDFAQAINTRPDLLADVAKVAPQFRSEALARLVYPTLDEVAEARAAAKEAGEVARKDIIRATMQDKATALMNAINKFRNLKGTDDIGVGSMLAVAMKGALGEGAQPSINEFRFTETLLYLAGITPRNGELFVQAGKDYSKANLMTASKTLLDDAQKIYGTAEDQLVARRLSILVGAYGSASRAKAELAELGLVLTAEERTAYNNWALGYGVTPEMRPRIEGAMRKLGANTNFQPDTILGVDMYIPLQARQRIADALQKAQFSEKRLTKAGDLYQMAFAFIKKRMTRGNFVLRQRYFMVNTIDHFFQMSLIIGYAPAFQSMARVALQNVMASLPGQVFETLVRGINLLPGAKINPAVVEKVRDALSRGGDKVAFGLRKMFSDAKYRVEVNHVLEGRNIPIVIGGHVTTGKRLREIMVGEGILESYNTRRLGQVIRQEGTAFLNDGDGIVQAGIDDSKLKGNVTTAWAKVSNAAKDILAFEMNIVDDIGDAWAERERVGAAVTLIENGYEPRLACRLTVDALYDYAQSMTKGDRSWLVGLMFPFWAFQKNANQQFINVLATPYGAYRMMVMKRFRDRGSELLTELYYDAVGGELGLDVNEMPQDMQDMYYAIMTKAHEVYGDEIPEDAKLALRMALTGRASEVIDGKYYELDDSLISMLKAGGVAGVGGAAMSEYMLPRPDQAILPSYMRERPGVFIAQRRNAMVRMYAGLRGKNDEMFYLMVPEASFEAAFKHVATVFGTGLMLGGYATAMTPAGPMLGLEETGLEGTELLQAIKPVLDLERSPIAGPVIGMYAERGYPQRLHPWFASLIQNLSDVPVLRVPAANDPFESDNFLLEMEKIGTEGGPKDINEILGADYVRTVQELNSKDIDPNDLSTIREERFYLPPGGYSIAFENTLGELNKELLIKWSRTPAERAEGAELLDMGNILFMLRNLTGLELSSVSASRTAQQEEPVFYTKSTKPF